MKETKQETFKKPPPFEETWWKHLTAGGLAGGISRSITAPIDRLKVLAQVSGKSLRLFSGISRLVKEEGFLSLWRGNGVNMLKIIPEYAIKFSAYEMGKVALLKKEQRPLSPIDRFGAAALAGVMSQTAIYPIEVLKTRMVVEGGRERPSIRQLTVRLLNSIGLYGFVRGYQSAMFGIILFTGTDLCVYETMKLFLLWKLDVRDILPAPVTVSCAVASCITGQLVAFPFSTISTAVQASNDKDITARRVFWERYQKKGVPGLYKGAAMAFTKAVPAVVLTYLIYEEALRQLGAKMT